MPFDPTKPANNSPIVSAELRSQFAALKQMLDELQIRINNLMSPDDVTDTINSNAAGPVYGVAPFSLPISSPPTQAEVQALTDKLNEFLARAKRM